MKLAEKLKGFIIPEIGPCHAPLKHQCSVCGEAFLLPEALASHFVFKHKGAEMHAEASEAILEHWAVVFPRWYVINRYATTDC